MRERLPRKVKKQIPSGMYCYTPKKYDVSTGIYHVKPCPFYTTKWFMDIETLGLTNPYQSFQFEDKKVEDDIVSYKIGWCKLKLGEYNHEIDDQCKNCGEKYDFKNHRNRIRTRLKKIITKHKWKY